MKSDVLYNYNRTSNFFVKINQLANKKYHEENSYSYKKKTVTRMEVDSEKIIDFVDDEGKFENEWIKVDTGY